MSISAMIPFRAAVRARLSSDPQLGAAAIYDAAVPGSGAAYPALVLGEKAERALEGFGHRGSVVSVLIEVHSRTEDDVELLTLATRIQEVLSDPPLALPGHAVVRAQTGVARTLMDPDGVTRRAEVRFEVTTQGE